MTAGEGKAYGNLGIVFSRLGQHNKAVEFHTKSLNISFELGDRSWEGRTYCNLGIAFENLGQYNKAVELHTKRLNISRELWDRAGEGEASGNLGNAFHGLGRNDKAAEFYTKHLNISHELGDRTWEGIVFGTTGLVNTIERSSSTRRLSTFLVSWGTGLGKARRMVTWVLRSIGRLGQYDKAAKFHSKCLNISRELGHGWGGTCKE